MSEEALLNKMFRTNTWMGKQGEYLVNWCELCETYIIGCLDKNCKGTSCNCTGCDKCIKDHEEFNKSKTSPFQYLNEEEKVIYQKIEHLKRLIPKSLKRGEKEINWQTAESEGNLCQMDYKLFEGKL